MVATYTILGRKVGSHVVRSHSLPSTPTMAPSDGKDHPIQLAMTVLGVTGGGIYLSLPGKQNKAQAPPIKASSKDEETFIQEFLKSVEAEDSKAKAKH
ncbi:hypothetical protein McanMca71_006004 [Microsporum canis]